MKNTVRTWEANIRFFIGKGGGGELKIYQGGGGKLKIFKGGGGELKIYQTQKR